MAGAYYNEIDPYAAQWLRNLIAAGHIAPGDVDERSIVDVRPSDLRGYRQCHFFAGIGVWSYALRLAGWPDDQPVWTGSCPCQPFSAAGRGGGFDDSRHYWPHWKRLIRELSPNSIFGEQVASKDGLAWFDFVSADLELAGYAIGAADLCAAGFGAPHIRQRLFFVGYSVDESRERDAGKVFTAEARFNGARVAVDGYLPVGPEHASESMGSDSMGDSASVGQPGRREHHGSAQEGAGRAQALGGELREQVAERRPTGGFWRDAEWIGCLDGKSRPIEPGTSPLAHGTAARVGRLRAYGNAIVAPVAAEFIRAYCELGG